MLGMRHRIANLRSLVLLSLILNDTGVCAIKCCRFTGFTVSNVAEIRDAKAARIVFLNEMLSILFPAECRFEYVRKVNDVRSIEPLESVIVAVGY